MKKTSFLIFCFVLVTSQVLGNVRWDAAEVSEAQTDNWSCGVHSAHRLLKTYEQDEDYNAMRNDIGPYNYSFDLLYNINDQIDKTVCDIWTVVLFGPDICITWKIITVTVEVTEDIIVKIDDIGIGKPTNILVDKLQTDYRSTFRSRQGNVSFQDVKDLLEDGRPVMALLQKGKRRIDKHLLTATGLIPAEAIWLYSSDIDVPLPLHWVIITGYDENYIYYYDTGSGSTPLNSEFSMSHAQFLEYWEWNHDGYNKNNNLAHDYLTSSAVDLDERTIIWIDEDVPVSTPPDPSGTLNNDPATYLPAILSILLH